MIYIHIYDTHVFSVLC